MRTPKYILICLHVLSVCLASHHALADKPEVYWGFTTQNFVGHLPVNLETSLEHVRYAHLNGLDWIELRDPDALLTAEECREISALARELGIEVNYSAQRGLLADDFWEVFERALINTALFDGLRTIRVLAFIGEHPYGWTADELQQMISIANEAVVKAAEHEVGFTIENADGAIDGDGDEYYGMIQLFDAIEESITLQLDTANLFTTPAKITPEEALAFIDRYAHRISYLHVKSAQDGKALPFLDGNPLGFDEVFASLSNYAPVYAVIELGPNPNAEAAFQNMDKSLKYLRENGWIE